MWFYIIKTLMTSLCTKINVVYLDGCQAVNVSHTICACNKSLFSMPWVWKKDYYMYKILSINWQYSMFHIFLFFVISCDYVFAYDMSIKSASCSLSFVMTYQCRGKNDKGRKDIFPEAIKTHTRVFQMQYNKCWTKWKRKRRE